MRNTEVWSGLIMGGVALVFYALQARKWRALHPYRRLGIAVGMATVVASALVSTLDLPWVGRYVLGSIIAGFLGYAVLYWLSVERYARVLSEFASHAGMKVIRNAEEESSDPDIADLRRWMDRDVYKWKVAGAYPALLKKEGRWLYVIRIPTALDFDYDAPVATCFAAVSKIPFNTLTLTEKRQASVQPRKLFATGNDAFDSRFFLTSADPADARTLFKDELVEALCSLRELPGTLRVEHFGVYYYRPGRVQKEDELRESLRIVETVCRYVEESIKTSQT